MFSLWQRASIDLATNLGSQSEMILSGKPILVNMCLINRLAILSAFAVFVVGMSIIPFVRPWSTTDKIASYPLIGGRSVIKSYKIWAKGLLDGREGIGISGAFVGCLFILFS